MGGRKPLGRLRGSAFPAIDPRFCVYQTSLLGFLTARAYPIDREGFKYSCGAFAVSDYEARLPAALVGHNAAGRSNIMGFVEVIHRLAFP